MSPVIARRRLSWPIIGSVLVVTAFGLAGIGTALALQQADALTTRLTVHATLRAAQIARTAAELFHYQINSSLRAAADHHRGDQREAWTPPPDWPPWMTGLFVWDGTSVTPIRDPLNLVAQAEELLRNRSFAPFPDPTELGGVLRAEIIYPPTGETQRVMAALQTLDRSRAPCVIAATIDPQGLRTELLDPLVKMEDGLEVKETESVDAPWSQSVAGAMRMWSIQPSRAYAREQRWIVFGQTAAYLGLTIVSLATMLAAMWVLARVAKREISLADMKASFVADVSHELKTPLALIRLFAETLLDNRVPNDEKRREYYRTITRESTRLTNLINNILDFSRIDAGRKEYTLTPIDVAKVIRETYEAYRPELEYREFTHRLDVAPSLPLVAADPDAVAQALVNLLGNAVKYSDDERYVAIQVDADTRRDVHGVLISVEDHGIGIRPEDRAHIFEGFYRSTDGRVRQRSGTGLGLSVVKHIVDAHGGTLQVEPKLIKGTAFRIFLPAAPTQTTPSN